ncbi:UDP-3-O-acyl-N-acetylglucosamine deacetylase [Aliivibrio sp. S4TY2]|jgi:UDP-3-O-[3-hydroxymyristoyl] N-acetylglucosamine deacetylase|uniref:UDP-3-O-acyl-N-acetylglucosamine deacetylase n=1 Tax=Aliivibrio finisterrensis TaxID=511998 RepID=A0A4Q5KVS4_9GAMM|nr:MULTISPECIES: UDP-3-O-acyl-N-acetylglucosamine deacetylase [Aliivibrio]MCP3698829.1 UDP-3-O-acyl-N-acetylglucosamine deacetylase [Aliivibrio sp.]KAB2824365.1 UDP-3-O-acyl-N-acetylglucosamine deacetylase [Aliivibrio finisterrensis]MDD9155904.1 UDP-3-O-acyl-N-acetylglucosamine deacetylase [Aliivibrio sp. S4TY2]MDD9159416.1 UDP-3-O-acyl-N-acetylglucosamine deacetylase [Aliivibrio sp. S4TY1]MDD9163612.1 UDP-3-O-acyl-N-acetylglucosamine deacetylase [Aliivibrio sp. S4MY2]
MIRQRTLKSIVQMTGVGLHSGRKVTLTLRPAAANTGVIYRRTDLNPPVDFPADPESVRDTMLCTALVNDEGVRISTVEHLNAALAGMGIDNVVIEVDAPEIPIMDGSASPFVYLLQSAGIEELNTAKKFIRIKKPVRIEDGDKWAEIRPYNGFRLDFTIDFNHPAIDSDDQKLVFDFSSQSFIKDISRARTFGFMRDIEYLQSQNLCLGGSFDCAIVLDDYRILNEDGLRFDNEFVTHKVLDAVGDLYMCGHSILGELSAYKSGHALNNQLLRAVLADQEAWEWTTIEDEQESPVAFMQPGMVLA